LSRQTIDALVSRSRWRQTAEPMKPAAPVMMIFIAQFPLRAIARLPESTAFLGKLKIRKAQIPAHAAATPMIARPARSTAAIFILYILWSEHISTGSRLQHQISAQCCDIFRLKIYKYLSPKCELIVNYDLLLMRASNRI
jgi:hypothetical protein